MHKGNKHGKCIIIYQFHKNLRLKLATILRQNQIIKNMCDKVNILENFEKSRRNILSSFYVRYMK